MKFVCIDCTTKDTDLSFPTLKDLAAHREQSHKGGRTVVPASPKGGDGKPPVVSKPPSAEDFARAKKELAEQNKPKAPKPVKLTYRYEGQCPEDGTTVSTIEVDVGQKHFVIALCTTCNKQLQSKGVAKL